VMELRQKSWNVFTLIPMVLQAFPQLFI